MDSRISNKFVLKYSYSEVYVTAVFTPVGHMARHLLPELLKGVRRNPNLVFQYIATSLARVIYLGYLTVSH